VHHNCTLPGSTILMHKPNYECDMLRRDVTSGVTNSSILHGNWGSQPASGVPFYTVTHRGLTLIFSCRTSINVAARWSRDHSIVKSRNIPNGLTILSVTLTSESHGNVIRLWSPLNDSHQLRMMDADVVGKNFMMVNHYYFLPSSELVLLVQVSVASSHPTFACRAAQLRREHPSV